ncbi:omega-conotoxin-like protein 1 [Episyrphus balteatus]|uniref:omega-conotoxin-like protein 1 n=1 Tax=Episyrphus balteatus TaxID=286459 RepID=UPI002485940F|nr:omega-conotoxin-like protein 1 [Episyrphus balteatus]
MAKLSLILLFALVTMLAIQQINGQKDSSSCGRHGDPCVSSSECCDNSKCHRYAKRCQVQITEDELFAQREKVLGRKGKDY